MSAYRLDVAELHRRLDERRRERGLSWRQSDDATGLASSTFTRIRWGHAPDAHGLVSLLVWLDLDTDLAYLIRPKGVGDA